MALTSFNAKAGGTHQDLVSPRHPSADLAPSLGAQVHHHVGRFFHEVTDPSMAVGMAVGLSAFNSMRALIQPVLMRSSIPLFSQVPYVTRTTSAALATIPEVGAFWGSSKAVQELVKPGSFHFDRSQAAQEMLGLGMTLGFLKSFGFLFNRAGTLARQKQMTGLPQDPVIWGQAGMLAGIMAGHGAEIGLGWRPPSDFSGFLADSLITLGHFNAGGALSHAAFPGLYRLNGILQKQMAHRERAQMRALSDGMDLNPGWVTAMAGAGGLHAKTPFPANSSPFIPAPLRMSALDPSATSGNETPLVHPELAAAQFRPGLPQRQGDEIGPFEKRGTNENLATDMVRRLRLRAEEGERQDPNDAKVAGTWEALEILAMHLGIPVRSGREMDLAAFQRVSDGEFGHALGSVMRWGMERFFSSEIQKNIQGEKFRQAPSGVIPNTVWALDTMMDVAMYLPRVGIKEAHQGYRNGLGQGAERLEDLKKGLILLLAPQIGVDRISPEEGALSHGWGAMLSFLCLLRHQIIPGELSWRYQLITTGTKPGTAAEIRSTGLNPKRIGNNVINFQEDPYILAVGPDGIGGLSQAAFHRSFQFQILNVPSKNLHEVFTPEFIEGLPEDVDFMQAIKGLVGPNRGRFSPEPHQQASLLPYEFVDQVMSREGKGTWGVTHVPGFIPAEFLFRGKPVSIAFAGPEFPEKSRRSPRAERLLRLFTGAGGNTPYIEEVGKTHWIHSSELGGAMKNIASVIAGFRAVLWAGENRGRQLDERAYESAQDYDIKRPLENMMLETLANEDKIRHGQMKFRSEVLTDVRSCLSINLVKVRELYEMAMESSEIPLQNEEAFVRWARDNIIGNRKAYAETRNPVMGIILGIADSLNAHRGGALKVSKIVEIIKDRELLTTEGTDGLHPFVLRNQHHQHKLELRGKPQEVVQIHDLIHPDKPAPRRLAIPQEVLDTLRGQIPFLEEAKVREALERRSQVALDLFSDEIFRYRELEREMAEHPGDERLAGKLNRQKTLLPQILTAMQMGNPIGVYDFPFYQDPFELAAQVKLEPVGKGGKTIHPVYAYLAIHGPSAMDRLTLLGRYLRSFGEEPTLRLDIQMNGLDSRDHAADKFEVQQALPEMLAAFLAHNSGAQIEFNLNGNKIEPARYERAEWEDVEAKYHQMLDPLLERLNRGVGSDGGKINGNEVRRLRYSTSALINQSLSGTAGWGSLMKFYAGPIQRAIKAGMSRPEKQTMVGIYSEGRLVEAFMVFRGANGEPMALNHGVTKGLADAFPAEYGIGGSRYPERYRDVPSLHHFHGLPLGEFLESYERLSAMAGVQNLGYRLIDLKSLPLETAMAGKISGVNPALLGGFLRIGSKETRDNMYRDLENLYEMPPQESDALAGKILLRYLTPFESGHQEGLMGFPYYRLLHELFDKHKDGTFRVLVLRGTEPALVKKMRDRARERNRDRASR